MPSKSDQRKTNKQRKWLYWIGGILAVFILAVAVYAYYVYDKASDTAAGIHTPLARDQLPERQANLKSIVRETKPLNILLLGVDQRPGDKGRSDTMILLSLNPKTESMLMLSIPRDTYVHIPDYGMDKINHAYAFGNVDLAIETVEGVLDIPIHFYAKVNMEGFEQGIDAIGGVTIQNDEPFSQGNTEFKKGNIHLSGSEALHYITMRKDDPRGDIGRNERQRKVVAGAIDEAVHFSSITKVGHILNILGDHVETNLNKDNIQTLFFNYRQTANHINTQEIEGIGQMIRGVSYYVVSDEEMERIQTEIKQHMAAS